MTGIEWCKVIISISLSIKPKESAVGTLTSLIKEYRIAVDFLVMMVLIMVKLPYHSIPISVMNAGKTAVPTFHFGRGGLGLKFCLSYLSQLRLHVAAAKCILTRHVNNILTMQFWARIPKNHFLNMLRKSRMHCGIVFTCPVKAKLIVSYFIYVYFYLCRLSRCH